jgi:hypothetical protein
MSIGLALALKAYLRKADCSKEALKGLGYDLEPLFEEAKKQGLEHTGSRDFVLRVTSVLYAPRVFAYPRVYEEFFRSLVFASDGSGIDGD